jgi:tRNA nucleotidyltransferase/poly(A) polymerase
MAWADAGASPEDPRWRQALTLADRWPVPEFPVRGPDIMALGNLKGPVIGDILRELEQGWIEGGFAEDREQLLAKAAKLASKAG